MPSSADLPPIEIERVGALLVVRDDRLPGGTKRRFLSPLLARWPEDEFVFGGPAEGYSQLALGWAARDAGKLATFVIAARAHPHPLTRQAMRIGVNFVEVRPGYLSLIQSRAKGYARAAGARFLPLGFDLPEVEAEAIAVLAPQLPPDLAPPEVWCVAGSGFLARVLGRLFPASAIIAVRIGMPPRCGRARVLCAPERFAQPAAEPPPFPSCANYDAKAWRFLRSASPGALFWNVGA